MWQEIPELKLIQKFLTKQESNELMQEVSSLPLVKDEIKLFGKTFPIPRKHLFMGDEGLTYTYSKITLPAYSWSPFLQKLREKVIAVTGEDYNSVLINYYESGLDSNGWHSDNERELGAHPALFSVSIGASRKFSVRKTGETKTAFAILLEEGDALWMKSGFQNKYQHSIPKTSQIKELRVNFTFRKVVKL